MRLKQCSKPLLPISAIFSNVQVGLVIRGRYVPLLGTANTEFADKKTHFDWKFGILAHLIKCEEANSQIKRPRITRSTCTTVTIGNISLILFDETIKVGIYVVSWDH
jgi:hypothetical protein